MDFELEGVSGKRGVRPFDLWMAQRFFDALRGAPPGWCLPSPHILSMCTHTHERFIVAGSPPASPFLSVRRCCVAFVAEVDRWVRDSLGDVGDALLDKWFKEGFLPNTGALRTMRVANKLRRGTAQEGHGYSEYRGVGGSKL